MAAPELSVVIPCYGRLGAFSRLLESFRGQTLRRERYEVIVVDDGNDPPIREVVAAELLDGVRLFVQPNEGPASGKNTGLRAARGRIVLFLNADALLTPTTLARHLAAHSAEADQPRAVLGRFDTTRGSWTALGDVCEGAGILFPYPLMTPGQGNPGHFFITCNISVPVAVARRAGGFDERFRRPIFEDAEFGFRLHRRLGVEVYYDPALGCGHDHPMYLSGLLQRSWMAGHEWLNFARKHGPNAAPALGSLPSLTTQSALEVLAALLAPAEEVARDRAALEAELATLDGLLADDPLGYAEAIEAARERLAERVRHVHYGESFRGIMNALLGFSEADTRRTQLGNEVVGTAVDADIVVRPRPGRVPAAEELAALRLYMSVSPAIGAVALRPGGSPEGGACVDTAMGFPPAGALVALRRECLQSLAGASDSRLGAQVRAHGRLCVTAWLTDA